MRLSILELELRNVSRLVSALVGVLGAHVAAVEWHFAIDHIVARVESERRLQVDGLQMLIVRYVRPIMLRCISHI